MCTCVQSHGRAPVRDDTVNDDQAYHVFIKQFQYQDAPLDPSRGARPGQAWNWDVLLIKMPKLVEAEVEVEMMVTDQDRTLTVTHLSNLWTLWRLLKAAGKVSCIFMAETVTTSNIWGEENICNVCSIYRYVQLHQDVRTMWPDRNLVLIFN